jgi:hypothetical protein
MVLTTHRNQQWRHRHRKDFAAPFASTQSRASRWYSFCAYSHGRIMRTSIICASVSLVVWTEITLIIIIMHTHHLVPQIIYYNVYSLSLLSTGRVTSVELSVPYLLVYHIILVLFLWSYFKTIFTEPRGAPPNVLTDDLLLLIFNSDRFIVY